MAREERLRRGLAKRKELFGEAGPYPNDVAPDLTALMDEVLWGEIWSRPGLDIKSRSMCTIAALTSLGRWDQLRVHIGNGLRVGLSQEQIVEILMQMAFYAGLPAARSALDLAKQVFDEHGKSG